MTRSHPPALLKLAARTIADERLLAPGELVMVAVSGGPDSMALLHVLATLAPKFEWRVRACGVDHGLRPAGAAEMVLAETFARDLGVPFVTMKVDLENGANLMARARAVRYEALERALTSFLEQDRAKPAAAGRSLASDSARSGLPGRIATAHHADDRAETVLLRLLRGAGPTGLSVLPPQAPPLVRPFIRARRADIMAHIERHRIPYAEDPSNRDGRFLRTRVRSEVLPLLAELSPQIVEHLCSLADAIGADRTEIPAIFEGISLGRAQRNSLARALVSGNWRARVPLKGGKVAGIDLTSRRIMLMKAR